MNQAIATLAALFPIANPFGAVPVFYSLTEGDSPAYRQKQARLTAINVIWVLAAFFLLGKFILNFFGISLGVLQIAGGLIVGHTAWEMVTAKHRLTEAEQQEAVVMDDISFTPMAMPIVSGPGAIGVIISVAEQTHSWTSIVGALIGILLLGLLLYLLLALGGPLVRRIGRNGMGTINRILGFFVLAIGVQLIVSGVSAALKEIVPGLLKLP